MNWKLKAHIQNLISLLPEKLSGSVYYYIQRHFGVLKNVNPLENFKLSAEIVNQIHKQNLAVEGKNFLEIGTGRRLNVPIGLWLCGAAEITTTDLNRYLKAELVFEDIDYIRKNRQQIIDLFGENAQTPVFQNRFKKLISHNSSFNNLLKLLNIKYISPADAAKLDIENQSIDFHISCAVLEHLPPELLAKIFTEGKRILKPAGLFVHCIDFSDHFAYMDKSISSVNFLQFSEKQWQKYAANRYMYHNRLRADEFLELVKNVEIEIVSFETEIDSKEKQLLENGFLQLDKRFADKPASTNATHRAWLTSRI